MGYIIYKISPLSSGHYNTPGGISPPVSKRRTMFDKTSFPTKMFPLHGSFLNNEIKVRPIFEKNHPLFGGFFKSKSSEKIQSHYKN